ncbi:ATP-dependent DNA helicase DinG [Petrocella atlantisensis]|uniref:ATP-dependent DNA helicase DinG n=1 Tax=Petrocella atlantisensis TaxID=2173034 RepID=A0A3P7S3C5_9FIRM|nr:ATP-dependent DNA helicase [Petrocella atlantisensis]VDN47249.1 ATP-dependent DNA helicase DinG [Petrocella atlantisensis]
MENKNLTEPLLSKWIATGVVGGSDYKIVKRNKDCMIIEKFTGKTYTYHAMNFITREYQYLFHKKQPIQDTMDILLDKKLSVLDFYGRHFPKSGEEMVRFIFEIVFTNYGYGIRKEQIQLSLHMYQMMTTGNISLSDVPVGLGKTHAYLVAAIVQRLYSGIEIHRETPVIITTSSIELQRAIVKDYLPEISQMLLQFGIIDKPITSVIRKGKDNYLCDFRLRDYIKNIDPKKKKLEELIILRQVESLNEIDLDELKGISQYDKKRICVNYNSCQVCLQKNICRYQQFMKRAKQSSINFQVCNHNYYLADVLRRKRNLSALLPNHKIVVIDEAHKLIDAARQMYGASISQRNLYNLANKAIPKKLNTTKARQFKETAEEVIKDSNKLFAELVTNIPEHINRDETEKFETILTSKSRVYLSRIISYLQDLIRFDHGEDNKYLSDLKRCIKELRVFQDWGIIYWMEQPFLKGQGVLASIPIALSKVLGEDLWSTDDSKLLTSGTLAVHKDFSYIKKELGMQVAFENRIHQVTKESPFDHKENCLLYIPENLPYPSYIDKQYLIEIGNKIEALVKASNGHALVLFTSYKPLKIVFEHLKPRLKAYELVQMKRGKKDSVNEFKKAKNGVYFATGSAWEGMDIPGDALSHLIVVKLPFPIPDPISEYERTMYASMDDYINAVVVPQMLIKLKQGIGRLIRKETDTGVISILDARATKGAKYHEAVLQALPDYTVVDSTLEIEQFLREKKKKEYFE